MSIPAIPARAYEARRQRVAGTWRLTNETVLIPSGLLIPVDGTDAHHAFHPHAEHVYLAGLTTPGQVLTYDPADGWTLFARVADDEVRIWEGDTEGFDSICGRSGLENIRDIARLGEWIRTRAQQPFAVLGNEDVIARPEGYRLEPKAIERVEVGSPLGMRLQKVVTHCRRSKDDWELARTAAATGIATRGHVAAMRRAKPGMTERELAAIVEAEFLLEGAEALAYESIVASRHRAAVLHGVPTDRVMNDGELVLIDAGARLGSYNSDITRTFPVGRKFSCDQRAVYEVVLEAQIAACAKVSAGKEYREIHLETCVDLARGLVDLRVLKGDPEDLVAKDIHALFFPHGVGHMMGLSTHDAGGYADGRRRSERFGLMYLRADIPLELGHVVTIEPGLYFIEALLCDPKRRTALESVVNWSRVDELMPVGGIRIEDDIAVTGTGPLVLTADCPKTIDEIEALREEALSQEARS